MVTRVCILIAFALARLFILTSRNVLRAFKSCVPEKLKQQHDVSPVETLRGVSRHAVSIIILGVAVLLSIDERGASIVLFPAAKSIEGIALGFCAPSLVHDFIGRLFMPRETQISADGYIETAGNSGTGEEVALHHLRLGDECGDVHFTLDGSICSVTNRSRGPVYAVIDMRVPRDCNLNQIIGSMQKVADDLRRCPDRASHITRKIEFNGIEKMEAVRLAVRGHLSVAPASQGRYAGIFYGT